MNHSFNIQLAKVYGIPGAILIQHFDFWLTKNKANGKHFRNGTYWTYTSMNALTEIFSYLTNRQIKYALQKLREADVIQTEQFNKSKHDQTNWYAFTETFLRSPCSSMVQFCTIDDSNLASHETNLDHRADDIVSSFKGSDVKTDVEPDILETWNRVLTKLQGRINEPSYNTWLRPTRILVFQESRCVIGVPSNTFVYWLEAYYTHPLQKAIKEITGKQMSVEYHVELPN